MSIKQQEIQHLMTLARLDVSKDEEAALESQLPNIIEYIGKLGEVNTDNIEETSQVTGLTNVMTNDTPCVSDIETTLLDQAPEVENNLIKVPKIIS